RGGAAAADAAGGRGDHGARAARAALARGGAARRRRAVARRPGAARRRRARARRPHARARARRCRGRRAPVPAGRVRVLAGPPWCAGPARRGRARGRAARARRARRRRLLRRRAAERPARARRGGERPRARRRGRGASGPRRAAPRGRGAPARAAHRRRRRRARRPPRAARRRRAPPAARRRRRGGRAPDRRPRPRAGRLRRVRPCRARARRPRARRARLPDGRAARARPVPAHAPRRGDRDLRALSRSGPPWWPGASFDATLRDQLAGGAWLRDGARGVRARQLAARRVGAVRAEPARPVQPVGPAPRSHRPPAEAGRARPHPTSRPGGLAAPVSRRRPRRSRCCDAVTTICRPPPVRRARETWHPVAYDAGACVTSLTGVAHGRTRCAVAGRARAASAILLWVHAASADAPPLPGLTSAEVAQRVALGQVNVTDDTSSRSLWAIVRGNLFTLFNAILGAALVVVLAVGAWKDAVFGFVLLFNTLIGAVTEYRAKRTLDRLAILNESEVVVVRDGLESRVPMREVVLDDVLRLEIGDQVPADGEVLGSAGLEVDESMLTGESEPVAKDAGDPVLSGSAVVAGSAVVRATRVGPDSYAQRITAQAKRFSLVGSELRDGINKVLLVVSWVIVPIAV